MCESNQIHPLSLRERLDQERPATIGSNSTSGTNLGLWTDPGHQQERHRSVSLWMRQTPSDDHKGQGQLCQPLALMSTGTHQPFPKQSHATLSWQRVRGGTRLTGFQCKPAQEWWKSLLPGSMGLKRVGCFFFPKKIWKLIILHTRISTSEICKQCTCRRWWAEKPADHGGTLSQQGSTRSISEAGSVFKGFWLVDLWLACTLLPDTPGRRVNTDHKWTTCSYSSSKCSVDLGLPPPDFLSRSSWLLLRPHRSILLPSLAKQWLRNYDQNYEKFPILMKIFTRNSFQCLKPCLHSCLGTKYFPCWYLFGSADGPGKELRKSLTHH